MLLDFATASLITLVHFPVNVTPYTLKKSIKCKAYISKKVQAFDSQWLVIVIVVHMTPKDKLERQSCVVIHQE